MQIIMKYFLSSILFTVFCLIAGGAMGYYIHHTLAGVWSTMFIIAVLGVLETSLSFDNAVVNATVLENMDDVWRHRFMTWGMLIAVFGMRVIFPLVIVAVVAHTNPINALVMAATQPDEYSRILTSAHVSVSAFGGAFLAMVGLKHFFDADKDVHWIGFIERPLVRLGRLDMIEIATVIMVLYGTSTQLAEHERLEFLVAGMFGLVTYVAVDAVGALFESEETTQNVGVKTGLAAFLYLEVLDASFSFDGVIGAFALSNNLFIIALGLGIGAMFVRSMTLMLVDKGSLAQYRYLEHGAFYAIMVLAIIMFAKTFMEVPEVVTGCLGAGLIAAAFWSSVRYNRNEAAKA